MSTYNKKNNLILELEYFENYQYVANLLVEWQKLKPENKKLKTAAQCLAKVGIYVASLQMEQQSFEKICSQYRMDKLKYQKEALESAEKLNNYEKKYFDEKSK